MEAMQDMAIHLQTCNVVHHTEPAMIVIADVSSLMKSNCWAYQLLRIDTLLD